MARDLGEVLQNFFNGFWIISIFNIKILPGSENEAAFVVEFAFEKTKVTRGSAKARSDTCIVQEKVWKNVLKVFFSFLLIEAPDWNNS